MYLFTSSVTVTMTPQIMDQLLINHKQYYKVADAVDFAGRRPREDSRPVKGVDFDFLTLT